MSIPTRLSRETAAALAKLMARRSPCHGPF